MKEIALVLFSFATILVLSFLKLGQHPLSEWDEARRGINTIEMLRTGDPVNLYFAGELETSNFKPPMAVWIKAFSLKILGFNELALRLPSAIAILVAFLLLFKIITLYRSPSFAALTCLVLASVKGLIGWHCGRTGDTDALLVLFHLSSIFFFLKFIEFDEKRAFIGVGICLGLAYLTKGLAAFTLLPGMALFAFFTNKRNTIFRSKHVWVGLAIATVFPVGLYVAHQVIVPAGIENGLKRDAFENQFTIDLFKRFTEADEGSKEAFNPTFFYYSLEKTFNLWHFVFFGFLAFGLFQLMKNREETWHKLTQRHQRLLLLSLSLYFPLATFLALVPNSHSWYMAPLLPFVGITTMWGICHFWDKASWVKWAFTLLLIFTLGRQLLMFWQVPPRPTLISDYSHEFKQAGTIVVSSPIKQDLLCYLYFFGKKMRFESLSNELRPGEVMLVPRGKEIPKSSKEVGGDDQFLIFRLLDN